MLSYEELRGVTESPSIGDNSGNREETKRVMREIVQSALTSRQQEVMNLYFKQGYSITQAAEIMGVHKSTASRTLRRALKRVKERIRYCRLR